MVLSDTYYIIPFGATILYLSLCIFGPYYMKNRNPWKVDFAFAVWNGFLALFSLYGSLRTIPHLLYRLMHQSFEETICESIYSAYSGGAAGLASKLFIFSKFIELFDTFFLIVKKRPILLLHWYHHLSVLLFCWHSMIVKSAVGLYFICMNYFVHTIMYSYFFLHSIKALPHSFPSWIITFLQILQMILGCIIIGFTYKYTFYGGTIYTRPLQCHNDVWNIWFGLLIYFTYLLFFIHFAWEKFTKAATPDRMIGKGVRNKNGRKLVYQKKLD